MSKIISLGLACVTLFVCTSVSAADKYRSPDAVDLPPVSKRVIVGTWLEVINGTACTKGIEQVKAKYYKVLRCSDGGGDTGIELLKINGTTYVPKAKTRNGDYYLINNAGELMIYDNQGWIARLPKHPTLQP